MKSNSALITFLLSMTIIFSSQHADASLLYEVVDVPDTIVGVDRMKITYHLGGTFAPFFGFNLIYDYGNYTDVSVISPLGPEWFQSITAPAPAAALDGLLTYMALTSIADASAVFEVEFNWTGIGTPGSQPIELFDDAFNIIESSRTTALVASVPEPSTLALMFAGLLLPRFFRRRPAIPTVRA